MQMKDAIWEQVLRFLPTDAAHCQPSDSLREGLGLDSLECVELVLQVERHFNIRFSDAELEGIHTIQDLLTGIEQRLPLPFYAKFFAQRSPNGR